MNHEPTRINLLPPELLAARAVRSRLRFWAAASTAAVACMASAAGMHTALAVTPTSDLETHLEQARADAEALQREISGRNAEATRLALELRTRHRITACPDWSPLMRLLAERIGERARLEGLEIKAVDGGPDTEGPPTSYRLMLSGTAGSVRSAMAIVLDLEETGLFEKVELIGSRDVNEDGVARHGFDIVCLLADRDPRSLTEKGGAQ